MTGRVVTDEESEITRATAAAHPNERKPISIARRCTPAPTLHDSHSRPDPERMVAVSATDTSTNVPTLGFASGPSRRITIPPVLRPLLTSPRQVTASQPPRLRYGSRPSGHGSRLRLPSHPASRRRSCHRLVVERHLHHGGGGNSDPQATWHAPAYKRRRPRRGRGRLEPESTTQPRAIKRRQRRDGQRRSRDLLPVPPTRCSRPAINVVVSRDLRERAPTPPRPLLRRAARSAVGDVARVWGSCSANHASSIRRLNRICRPSRRHGNCPRRAASRTHETRTPSNAAARAQSNSGSSNATRPPSYGRPRAPRCPAASRDEP
jgi:hypothetical protein